MTTHQKAGTLGGALFGLVSSFGQDVLHTALVTAVAATVSFAVSFTLNRLVNRDHK